MLTILVNLGDRCMGGHCTILVTFLCFFQKKKLNTKNKQTKKPLAILKLYFGETEPFLKNKILTPRLFSPFPFIIHIKLSLTPLRKKFSTAK